MKLVGRQGHSEASVVNITRAAGVSLGTFYVHFESKQELLNELLPWAGREAHREMDAAVEGVTDYVEYEIRNFDALISFEERHPYYFRLLSEAEVATPQAYQEHIDRSVARYCAALAEAHGRGEFPDYGVADLLTVATMLVSIKILLFTRLATGAPVSDDLRRIYFTFVFNALYGKEGQRYLQRIGMRPASAKATNHKP